MNTAATIKLNTAATIVFVRMLARLSYDLIYTSFKTLSKLFGMQILAPNVTRSDVTGTY